MLKEPKEDNKREAKKILDYNIKRIYGLSVKKYPYLCNALRGDLGETLRGIINFWRSLDKGIALFDLQTVYFLGTQKATYGVRNKTTKSVTNRQINYLCAIGLLNKVAQQVEYTPKRRVLRNMPVISRKILAYSYNNNMKGVNTFFVEKYTTEFLLKCNEIARMLQERKITVGNMSYNQLALNGLEDIAERVYHEDRSGSVEKKLREYGVLVRCMDKLIAEKGYTTKQEIYENCAIEKNEVDKLFKLFKNELWQSRTYKAPNQSEREKYGLRGQSWIIQNKVC